MNGYQFGKEQIACPGQSTLLSRTKTTEGKLKTRLTDHRSELSTVQDNSNYLVFLTIKTVSMSI